MFQGFYNLASGMLTQNRNLNVISNNMANVTTPGFKSDTMTSTTFQQEMYYRTGNQHAGTSTQLGSVNMIRVPEQTVTDYTQGNYVETGGQLDFAINGKGFFRVVTPTGDAYTRNGSFYVDEEGSLALKGVGKVQGTGGDIFLDSDSIMVDPSGGLYDQEGELIDNLEILDFQDYAAMVKDANGIFTTEEEGVEPEVLPGVIHKTLEQSNVSSIQQMQNMMSTQRSLQSDAQILKIYDQIMAKATTEIGRF